MQNPRPWFLFRLVVSLFIFSLFCIPHVSSADSVKRGMVVLDDLNAEGVAVLKSWNVNVVRYSFAWADQTLSDNSTETTYNAWLDEAIAKFDTILPLLQAEGIKVVLNLHTPPGGFTRRDSKATHRVFTEQWAQDAFVAAWEKIATHYKENSSIWAFDLLNEPAQYSTPTAPLLDWNALAQLAAERVRVIDAVTPLMMTPVYGKLTRLSQMKVLTVPNVYYTIHFYDPWKFIHQGIYGVKMGLTYPSKDGSKAKFTKSLRPLARFKEQNNTEIFIGEFSVARWAPSKSSQQYLTDLVSIFKKYNFHWVYHCFRGPDIWDLEMSDKRKNKSRTPTPSGRLKAIQKGLQQNTL